MYRKERRGQGKPALRAKEERQGKEVCLSRVRMAGYYGYATDLLVHLEEVQELLSGLERGLSRKVNPLEESLAALLSDNLTLSQQKLSTCWEAATTLERLMSQDMDSAGQRQKTMEVG